MATGNADAAPLTDRDEFDRLHGSRNFSILCHDLCRPERNALAEKRLTAARLADEAHVLAVGLRGSAQSEFDGALTNLGLRQMSDGKERVGKLRFIDHVDDVTLILGIVRTAMNAQLSCVVRRESCVMSRGDGVESELARPLAQTIELEMPIAFDARVRREPVHVGINVWLDDVGVEVIREIEYQVVDSELLGDSACIIHVAHRATARVTLPAPQPHRHADHVVALRLQFGSGDRGVDAT